MKIKIQNQEKSAVWIFIIVLSIGYIVYNIFLAAMIEKIQLQKQQAAFLEKQIAAYEKFAAQHADYESFITEKKAELIQRRKKIPQEVDTAKMLDSFYVAGNKWNIKVLTCKVMEAKAEGKIFEIPVELVISGNYFNILKFLDYIEATSSCFVLKQVSIKGNESTGNIELKALLNLYELN